MGLFDFFRKSKKNTEFIQPIIAENILEKQKLIEDVVIIKKNNINAISKMFPEPLNIFENRIEEHAKYLFPLFSINLKELNNEWEGEIHMLSFNVDPYNQDTVLSFNTYCNQDVVGFDINNGRYSFKTDFNYFALSTEWIEYFEEAKNSFRKTKNYYFDHGELPIKFKEPGKYFEQMGGFPEWVQTDQTPLDPDGVPMSFIASVYTGTYSLEDGGQDLYLFYSHKFKLAVIISQIT